MRRSLKRRRSRNREWYPSGQYLYTAKDADESKFKVKHVSGNPQFTLAELETGRWSLTGMNSNGSRRQERVDAVNLDVAIEEAAKRLGYAFDPFEEDMTIARVSKRWLDSLDVREETRSGQYQNAVDAWFDFTDSKKIKLYRDLRREHFQGYLRWCQKRFNGWTPYHYVGKIRAMIRWASLNWSEHFKDFAAGLKIPKPREDDFREDRDALTVEQVLEFCDFLGTHPEGWRVRPAVALCGLAGLSVLEALRLTWEHVHFEEGYIDITGERKNAHRKRRIPLPAEVWQVLRTSSKDDKRVVPVYQSHPAYQKAFDRLFDAWTRPARRPRRRRFPDRPKRFAGRHPDACGVGELEWLRPGPLRGPRRRSIRQKHYTKVSEVRLLADMRSKVTDRIDSKLASWRAKSEQKVKYAAKRGRGRNAKFMEIRGLNGWGGRLEPPNSCSKGR